MSSLRPSRLLVTVLAILPGACAVHVAPLSLDGGDPGSVADEAVVEDLGGPADLPTADEDVPGIDAIAPDGAPDPGPGDVTPADVPEDDGAAPDDGPVPDDGTAPDDVAAPDTTCVPSCDGIQCGTDDGCGGVCGCGTGYACRDTQGACVYSDWTASYYGQFTARVHVQAFPGISSDVECQGGLNLAVQVGARPAVQGQGQCTTQASLVSATVLLVFQGDIQDLDRVVGFVQYEVNGNGVGQGPFTAQFTGPDPRKVSGAMDSGPTYDNGQIQVVFLGANWDAVEAL